MQGVLELGAPAAWTPDGLAFLIGQVFPLAVEGYETVTVTVIDAKATPDPLIASVIVTAPKIPGAIQARVARWN